ncbi:FAD-dependent oxidoreductase [Pseudomonas lini]
MVAWCCNKSVMQHCADASRTEQLLALVAILSEWPAHQRPRPSMDIPKMPAPLTPVETNSVLATDADVVVIGGGIVGTFTAYYLAKRGMKVALVEKKDASVLSSRVETGAGAVSKIETPVSCRCRPKSLELWEQFAAESGEDTGFRRCGLLYLSNNEKELAGWAQWGEFARTVDVKKPIC